MKEYRIKPDGKVYQVCESAEDLGIKRYTQLKLVIIEQSAGMKIPDLLTWFANRRKYYNTNDIYSLLTEEINLATAIQNNSTKIFSEASHLIFGLIVNEEGEDRFEYDATKITEKLYRMAQEGLTQGEVLEVTENFITASPILCESFFLMSLLAMQKTLKSSEPMLTKLHEQLGVQESLIESELLKTSET